VLVMKPVFQTLDFLERGFQPRARQVLFGDVDPGSDVLHYLAQFVEYGVTNCVQILDRAVAKNDAIVGYIIGLLRLRTLVGLPDHRPIVRMDSVVKGFDPRQAVIGWKASYSKHFRRNRQGPRQEIVSPTTGVAQSLSFKQIGFTAAQLLFCLFSLRD